MECESGTHTTDVVPSPHSMSCVLEMSIKILAAGLSIQIDFKIVAPSFVTNRCEILGVYEKTDAEFV